MTDSIISELKQIKEGDKNLHQHLKKFISHLVLDRSNVYQFESYSAQSRINGGVNECVFKVREAYSHLRDFEGKQRSLLGVSLFLDRNLIQALKKNLKNQPLLAMSLTSMNKLEYLINSVLVLARNKLTESSNLSVYHHD